MRQITLVFLIIGVFLPVVAFATPEEEALAFEGQKLEFAHAGRLKELDIQAQEAKLDFERQMHELELEARRTQIQRQQRGPYHHRKKCGGAAGLIGLIMIIIRVLATIWVCRDLQQRKTGSGLWIPIVLLGGLLGLLVYAVIRLGDMRQTQTAAA